MGGGVPGEKAVEDKVDGAQDEQQVEQLELGAVIHDAVYAKAKARGCGDTLRAGRKEGQSRSAEMRNSTLEMPTGFVLLGKANFTACSLPIVGGF